MPADCIGPWSLDVTNDKHADGTQVGHRDTRLRADHLFRDAFLDAGAGGFEAQAAYCNWSEFRKTDIAVTIDLEDMPTLRVPEQLHFQPITWPDHVIDWYWDVLNGRKR